MWRDVERCVQYNGDLTFIPGRISVNHNVGTTYLHQPQMDHPRTQIAQDSQLALTMIMKTEIPRTHSQPEQ